MEHDFSGRFVGNDYREQRNRLISWPEMYQNMEIGAPFLQSQLW